VNEQIPEAIPEPTEQPMIEKTSRKQQRRQAKARRAQARATQKRSTTAVVPQKVFVDLAVREMNLKRIFMMAVSAAGGVVQVSKVDVARILEAADSMQLEIKNTPDDPINSLSITLVAKKAGEPAAGVDSADNDPPASSEG